MTHYLRSQHDAILVGAGTAVADNPALNCRIEGVGLERQPRPVIVDPRGRWRVRGEDGTVAECVRLARKGVGKGPWVVTGVGGHEVDNAAGSTLEDCGGRYICLSSPESSGSRDISWTAILESLADLGIESVMVEGGGHVINTLLQEKYLHLIDSVIVTIAPVWLGVGGVVVSPPSRTDDNDQRIPAARLHQTKWQQFGDDVVMCGRIKH